MVLCPKPQPIVSEVVLKVFKQQLSQKCFTEFRGVIVSYKERKTSSAKN